MAKSYKNLYQRGGIWTYDFRHAGKRYKASCNTSNVREAEKILRDVKAALEYGNQPPPALRHTPGAAPKTYPSLDEMFERHAAKARRERNSSDHTIRTDLRCRWNRLKQFYAHMGEVTPESVHQYIDFQLRRGIRQQTIKKDLYSVRLGNGWARETHPDLPEISKLPRLKDAESGKQAGRAIDDADLQAWLAQLTPHGRAIALLALLTGLRAWTIRALEESFIKTTPRDPLLAAKLDIPARAMKAKRPHQVGLTPFGLRLLRQALPRIGEDPKTGFNAAARRARIENVSLRALRHTFATRIGQHDPFGVELVLAHRVGGTQVSAAYHHANDERLGRVAKLAEEAFARPWLRRVFEVVRDSSLTASHTS